MTRVEPSRLGDLLIKSGPFVAGMTNVLATPGITAAEGNELRDELIALRAAAAAADEPPAPRRPSTVCGRCTCPVRPDVWGKWVDEHGGRTCGGDRSHVPAGLEGLT